MIDLSKPLSDTELDRLAEFLAAVPNNRAMNLEALDGFFAALIAGPEMVLPSEYWPVVLGGESGNYETLEQARDIMGLVNRHWNGIARTLNANDVHLPLILLDDEGIGHGSDWAKGFMRGIQMRPDSWQPFLHDDERAGAVLPMMMLAHEDDPDPELRAPTLSPEKRDEMIQLMAAGLMNTHRYFAAERQEQVVEAQRGITYRREGDKVGRNMPCPCGSGKKFKQCCGKADATRH